MSFGCTKNHVIFVSDLKEAAKLQALAPHGVLSEENCPHCQQLPAVPYEEGTPRDLAAVATA